MGNQLYINCLIGGILGMAFYLFAIKIPAVKARALTANMPFSMKAYFKEDYLAIIASLLAVFICVWLLDEMIGYNPSFLRYIKFFFLFIGYTGSSLLVSVLGKFDKTVQKVVDIKTNLADGK